MCALSNVMNACDVSDIVRRLLDCGADVSRVTNTADTMLHGSVYGNKPEITEMLIKAGCDVNAVNSKNELPLYTAVDHRAENEVKYQLMSFLISLFFSKYIRK